MLFFHIINFLCFRHQKLQIKSLPGVISSLGPNGAAKEALSRTAPRRNNLANKLQRAGSKSS